MHKVSQDEAIAHLPDLIDEANRHGEEVAVMRGQVQVAKIVPTAPNREEPKAPRKAGSAKAKGYYFYMAEDFDAPLGDFAEYM
jgi:antitoxin (DNA-binding transcriptional repressor) of toxin-antitoxin stability system